MTPSNPGDPSREDRVNQVIADYLQSVEDGQPLDRQKLLVQHSDLAEDLTAQDGSSIPAGKKIHAHVSNVERGMHGRLLLSFDEIDTRRGWRPLAATVSDVPGEHGAKARDDRAVRRRATPCRRGPHAEGAR